MSIMVQNRNNRGGVPNKIGASLFLLVFALSGMFFMGIMAYSFYQGAAAGSWVETPCRITAGEIVYPQRSGSKYSYKVAYSYVYSGRNYSATRLSFNTQGGEYKKVLKLSQDYAPGMDVKCYVNPSNPSDAVLVRKVDLSSFRAKLPPAKPVRIKNLQMQVIYNLQHFSNAWFANHVID